MGYRKNDPYEDEDRYGYGLQQDEENENDDHEEGAYDDGETNDEEEGSEIYDHPEDEDLAYLYGEYADDKDFDVSYQCEKYDNGEIEEIQEYFDFEDELMRLKEQGLLFPKNRLFFLDMPLYIEVKTVYAALIQSAKVCDKNAEYSVFWDELTETSLCLSIVAQRLDLSVCSEYAKTLGRARAVIAGAAPCGRCALAVRFDQVRFQIAGWD